jgi:hypothetical protein
LGNVLCYCLTFETLKPRILKSQIMGPTFTFSKLQEMFCAIVWHLKPRNPKFWNLEIWVPPLPFWNFGKCFLLLHDIWNPEIPTYWSLFTFSGVVVCWGWLLYSRNPELRNPETLKYGFHLAFLLFGGVYMLMYAH